MKQLIEDALQFQVERMEETLVDMDDTYPEYESFLGQYSTLVCMKIYIDQGVPLNDDYFRHLKGYLSDYAVENDLDGIVVDQALAVLVAEHFFYKPAVATEEQPMPFLHDPPFSYHERNSPHAFLQALAMFKQFWVSSRMPIPDPLHCPKSVLYRGKRLRPNKKILQFMR